MVPLFTSPGLWRGRVGWAPSLALSGQLLLLANRERSLTELNLRLVASYLASLRPAPTAGDASALATAGTAPLTGTPEHPSSYTRNQRKR